MSDHAEQRLISGFGRQIRTCDYVLVDPNCAIDLPPAPKQITKGKVRLNRFVVNSHHFEEMFECLVGLFVQQEVQALQIVDIQRRWRVFVIAFAKSTHRPSSCRKQQE